MLIIGGGVSGAESLIKVAAYLLKLKSILDQFKLSMDSVGISDKLQPDKSKVFSPACTHCLIFTF